MVDAGSMFGLIFVLFFGLMYIAFFVIWIVFMLAMLLGGILWILMLIDVLQRKFETENDRVLWVLVVVLTGVIGAVIYYFLIKSKDKKIPIEVKK